MMTLGVGVEMLVQLCVCGSAWLPHRGGCGVSRAIVAGGQ